MFDDVLKNPWVRAGLALLAVVGVAVLGWLLRPVLVPLFFAFIAAYILDPLVDRLERFKIRRMVSIVLLAAVGIGVAVAGPLLLLPSIISEADHLIGIAQERMQTGVQGDAVYGALNRLPLREIVEGLGWAPVDTPDYDPLSVIIQNVGQRVREGASEFLVTYSADLFSFGNAAAGGVAGAVASAGRAIMGVVLTIGKVVLFGVVAGYLLRDYDGIVAVAKDLVPLRHRDRVFRVMGQIDGQLRGFMRGQMLVCLALGVIYSIGLTLSDVPFGFALGIFGGAASFVPYLGLILTALPAGLLCIVQHGGIEIHLLGVVATFVIAQMLEGTVITPKVVGEQVGLGPVWVILAVMVFGNALGFLGLLLAVPLAATLKVLVVEGIAQYRVSPVYLGPPPPEPALAAREAESPPPTRRSTKRRSRKPRA